MSSNESQKNISNPDSFSSDIQSHSENTKRIAKNTLTLYVRMLFSMLVGLFTSRIVLDALGEINYGIYNVVGGIVPILSVLTGALSGAISRFITFELGTGNQEKLNRIFSTSVNIQFIMALAGLVLCEIAGVWFLNEKMNIPADRMDAANFVLQCSIASFMVSLVSVPYTAIIIAHEKMSAFAYISIVEVVLKLVIAYLMYISPVDTLKLYAALLLGVSILMRIIYGVYCGRHFPEAKYHFIIDRPLLKEMFSFAGWNLFGNTAYMLNTQGVNMLVNVFFGVTTNAAQAIASQVNGAVSQFVGNFTTAINPQITKSYASNDQDYLYKLVCRGTKYTFFIMYLFLVPIILEADTILEIWLKEVPADSGVFVRLVLISSLATVIGNPMLTTIMATGKIRRYQVVVTTAGCLVFPLTWIAFSLGCPAYVSYIIYAVIYFLLNFIRLATLKRLIGFPVGEFNRKVFSRIGGVSVLAFFIPGIVTYMMEPSFIRLLLVCIVSLLWSLLVFYYIGIDKEERMFFKSKIRNIAKHRLLYKHNI